MNDAQHTADPGRYNAAVRPPIPTAEALSRTALQALDSADPLAELRQAFRLPDDLIYLNGNSLGPLSHAALARLTQCASDEWGDGLVGSWNHADWVGLPRRVGAQIARLIGAAAAEVIAADSTSINLFKLLWAALQLRPQRRVILTESDNFPTDNYIAAGVAALAGSGYQLRRVSRDQLPAALGPEVAILLLSHVNYRDGYRHDLRALSAAARDSGALSVWDLAHSAGAIKLEIGADGADFAVGCGYKFLNGGPGAPAFAFAAERWHATLQSPLTGWFGHQRPFDFAADFAPAAGIDKLQVGTPGILGLSALDGALAVFSHTEPAALQAKSEELFELCLRLLEQQNLGEELVCITPRESAQRGSQISLRHPAARSLGQALAAAGVIGDFRPPDVLRFGLTPLYTRRVDIFDAVHTLATIMREQRWQRWQQPAYQQDLLVP